ncbi:MAG: PLDc N-terminal domain-containing protein [bacterium]|nr:PLDc N-terminal domain-containing protein [bacterium]
MEDVLAPIIGLFAIFFAGLMFLLYFLFIILVFVVTIGGTVLWIMMIIDVIQRPEDKFPDPGENTRLMWILVVVLTGIIGAGIYYFMVKKKMKDLEEQKAPVPSVKTKINKKD